MPRDLTTKEPQYQRLLDVRDHFGIEPLGLMANQWWHDDPRKLAINLARYKFVAKMMRGRQNVAEIGCGDAFGTRLVQQEVPKVTVYDFDPVFVQAVADRNTVKWGIDVMMHDILTSSLPRKYDGLFCLDVFEHIPPKNECQLIQNLIDSFDEKVPAGTLIVGTPSLESQSYASDQSKAGHVNCKSGEELKALFEEYFNTVFLFGMNDEVIHCGFTPMCHYLFAVCVK